MYFSTREKQIVKLLVENTEGITQPELQDLLQISKRTLYREMSSIEKSLQPFEVQLIKPRGQGYRLVGDIDQLMEIKSLVVDDEESVPLDSVHRQSALASSLLLADEEQTIESLAIDFGVSTSTIHADLQVVEESLAEYSLKLDRRKARGIIIVGGEYERRQILSNMIYSGVNEYEFFSYVVNLDQNKLARSTNFFLNLISPSSFYLSKTIILDKLKNLFVDVTDNQVQQIITILALSIDRALTEHIVEMKAVEITVSQENLKLSQRIMESIETTMHLEMSAAEQLFFARQLEGVNYKKPQNIFLESFDVELSFQVRELIRMVSKRLVVDFRMDDTLYYDLLTHLSAAFKRMGNLVQFTSNPLLEKVLEEYPKLTIALRESLAVLFWEDTFSEDELAYIVIHFAASIERNPIKRAISALVLCSSGIGTARILESRLKKYVPEIDTIEIMKLSQMSHIDFKTYDLILSTIYLPNFALPYKLISPLLLDDEIQKLKQEIFEKRFESKVRKPNLVAKEAEGSFEQVYNLMRIANDLLTQFDVKPIQTRNTLSDTMVAAMDGLEGVIVTDAEKVSELVLQRHQRAPIGIPNTNFALFHSSNQYVKQPYFGIFDLNRSMPIMGMDRKPMALTRMLLMLAPETMTDVEDQLLGLISASVIESDLNMEIYQHESKEVIYELISALFVNKIKEIEEE